MARISEKRQLLEKEKLETELKFLKSQFNPHFLFNTINSIFVLIDKNAPMASESLAKFSGILRYQLYECNESQIPLEKEINYIKNYIELEELRLNEDVEVKTDLHINNNSNLAIAPFILMPFIENAFKHVSKTSKNWIKIRVKLNENQLVFKISNSLGTSGHASNSLVKYTGLGLKNVKRRLDLLYPGEYELDISTLKDCYKVHLVLNLKENKIKKEK